MRWSLICAAGFLAACSTSMDVSNTAEAKLRKTVPNAFDSYDQTLRAYQKVGGKRSEIAGAVCSLKNDILSLPSVTTPSTVRMPSFLQADRFANRGKPPKLAMLCKFNGQSKSFTVEATSQVTNQTTQQSVAYGNGYVGTASTTRLTGRLSSTLPWRYILPAVEF